MEMSEEAHEDKSAQELPAMSDETVDLKPPPPQPQDVDEKTEQVDTEFATVFSQLPEAGSQPPEQLPGLVLDDLQVYVGLHILDIHTLTLNPSSATATSPT